MGITNNTILPFSPGTVLLYEAPALTFSNIVPNLIRLITGNKITHTALYICRRDNKHILLDAELSGIKLIELDDTTIVKRKDGFVLRGLASLPVNTTDILKVAEQYAGKSYGILTIINLLLQHGKTRIFPKSSWSVLFKSRNGFICSQVCQLVLEDLIKLHNENITFPKQACLTEPDDYLSAPWKVVILQNV